MSEISPPSNDNWDWLQKAEAFILELLRSRYGDVNLEHTEEDLHLAQRLIDENVLCIEDLLELQCLGVILGNVFTAHTSMEWVLVSNEFGDMLALHSQPIEFTLYPLTMVSKRVADGRRVSMPQLYHSFVHDLGLPTH